MEIEEGLIAHLLDAWVDLKVWVDTELWNEKITLNSLVGRRIFPEDIPQNTAIPAISIIKISDVKDHTLTRQLANESPVFQFSVFAKTKASARAVTNQIKQRL